MFIKCFIRIRFARFGSPQPLSSPRSEPDPRVAHHCDRGSSTAPTPIDSISAQGRNVLRLWKWSKCCRQCHDPAIWWAKVICYNCVVRFPQSWKNHRNSWKIFLPQTCCMGTNVMNEACCMK